MFGNNIRNLRTERKISLAKFSEITGISKGYSRDIENGKATNPSLNVLKEIATNLNCSISDILQD